MSKNEEAPKDGVSRRRMLQAGGLFALGASVEGCNVNLQRLANGLTSGSNSNTSTGTSAMSVVNVVIKQGRMRRKPAWTVASRMSWTEASARLRNT